MAKRPRLTRLDVLVMLVLIVVGAGVWPVAKEILSLVEGMEAPREIDYQERQLVLLKTVKLKGIEDQLAKTRAKVADIRLSERPDQSQLSKMERDVTRLEAIVTRRSAEVARLQLAASDSYALDRHRHEWKERGLTAVVAIGVLVALLVLALLIGGRILKRAELMPAWGRILPMTCGVVLLLFAYQAGQVTGLIVGIAMTILVAIGWLAAGALSRRPRPSVADPPILHTAAGKS